MKSSHIVTPALVAIFLAACAAHPSAPDRAQQAEADKAKAQEQARDAKYDAEKERLEAQDATRAQREADQNAQFAAQRAAHAEADAQLAARGGVAEPQVASPEPVVNGDVAFASGNVDLSAEGKAKLDEIARGMRAHPSRTLVVEGYADDTGTASTDMKVSRRRADAVARYLESDGISSDRIAVKAYGARNPAYNDVTPSRRTPNRRVEVIVQPEK